MRPPELRRRTPVHVAEAAIAARVAADRMRRAVLWTFAACIAVTFAIPAVLYLRAGRWEAALGIGAVGCALVNRARPHGPSVADRLADIDRDV